MSQPTELISEFSGYELLASGTDAVTKRLFYRIFPNPGWGGRVGLPRMGMDEDTIASELEWVFGQLRSRATELVVEARRLLDRAAAIGVLELHYRECIVSAGMVEEAQRQEALARCELIRNRLQEESSRLLAQASGFFSEFGISISSLDDVTDAAKDLIFRIQDALTLAADAASYSILVSTTPLISGVFGAQAPIGITSPTPQPQQAQQQQAQAQQAQAQQQQPQQRQSLLEQLFGVGRGRQQGGG